MARFALGPLFSSSAARRATPTTADPIEIKANTTTITINTQAKDAGQDLLLFFGATSLTSFDLHLITDQCALLAPTDTFYFNIGSERSRPNSGYIYAQYVAGAHPILKSVNFGQIVGNY